MGIQESRIIGMRMHHFFILAIMTIVAMYMGILPSGLAGIIPLLLVLGEGLKYIGDRIPIVKDYLGGGSCVVLFGCAALVMYGLIPKEIVKETKSFMVNQFIDFALAALCCGSIFGMSRSLLLKASLRYIPCILGGVIVALGLASLVGLVLGYGIADSILYIALPIMGGGTSAGAVPMSQMFGEIMNRDMGEILAIMTPAVALGNAFAIVLGGLLDTLGKKFPRLTGNGHIMRVNKEAYAEDKVSLGSITDLSVFATGMAVAGIFLAIGKYIQSLIPSIHAYAWMILLMVIVKMVGIIPKSIEEKCTLWFKFFISNFTGVLLAGLGIGLISLKAVIPALTPTYLLLVLSVVVGAVLGSAIVGYFVGFYPIEAAITGGLCMANMGGSGDIATLGAAKRMELMPFAAVSSRLGGALILILGSVILSLFL